MNDMSSELTYKKGVWTLKVNGKEIPNSHVIYDGLEMRNDEPPTVAILVDSILIEDIEVEERLSDTRTS